ncbi:uroporphyrinogen-III synthase [Pandoraea sp.]|uniref:uroporphyrinogen-III synthase n=1 Tax=Pandoraea sp. TaxID=1883445 RepID=UPI0025E3CE83|nr:uroporphyrinogen-III synthase [Pandoraea sp.]
MSTAPIRPPPGAHSPVAVLTRPAGQSAWLAGQLAEYGIEPLEFPLLEILPVPDDMPLRAALANLPHYALVCFVSPNAVRHALEKLPCPWPGHVAAAVVGPGSAGALADFGIAAPDVEVFQPPAGPNARFDSDTLLTVLPLARFAGRRVLLVRGDGGRDLLLDRLREAGALVDVVSAYVRRCPTPPGTLWRALDTRLASGRPISLTLTSSEAVGNLDALTRAHFDAAERVRLHRADCFTSHERIAKTARAAGFGRITLCGAGDRNLLQALKSWANPYLAKHADR